jgi:hypothetical protein
MRSLDELKEPLRYKQAVERIIKGLGNRSVKVMSQAPLKPDSLYDIGTEEYRHRLAEICARVNKFLTPFDGHIGYDLGTLDALRESRALDDAVILYAMGGVDDKGVEATLRAYVRACKRPEGHIERGSPNPPPRPGTYPGKTQPSVARQLDKPAPPLFSVANIPQPEGEPEELDPDSWRIAVTNVGHTPVNPTAFIEKPFEPGALCYAKLNPASVATAQGEGEYAVQVLIADHGLSYYFKARNNPVTAYQYAEEQERIDYAWKKGFVSVK